MRLRVLATRSTPAALAVARALRLSSREASRLLSEARVLPAELEATVAAALQRELGAAGVRAELLDVPRVNARCGAHPGLTADVPCETCRTLVCPLCTGAGGRPACSTCDAKERRRRRNRAIRVAVLLLVLAGVLGWGLHTVRGREARTRWVRTLAVDVVLVATGPVDDRVVSAWRGGLGELEGWFTSEAARHGLPLTPPVRLRLVGPVVAATLPAPPGPAEGWLDGQRRAWALHRTLASLVEGAAAGGPSDFDVVVTLAAGAEGAPRFVEGVGEAGGRFGLVQGAVEERQVSLELAAVAHELLHGLGAADQYDEDGHARVPGGLADATKSPLYPQVAAEVMCGEVSVGPAEGRVPKSLAELRVSAVTARAIRWVR